MNQVLVKIIMSLIFTVLLGVSVFLTQPEKDYSKLMYDWFWVNKTFPSERSDVLIIGDSRVYRGVSPISMQEHLSANRIHNMGYSSGSMSKLMFDYCITKLNYTKDPILVLGITPYSLTTDARKNTHLKQEYSRPLAEILERKYINPYLRFFEPIRPADYKADVARTRYLQEFYANGWAASTKVPANPKEALSVYSKELQATSISDSSITETLQFVKEQVEKDVQVYAFRPPSTTATEILENELTKFDFANFISKFEEAGGKWIYIHDKENYRSYDGSHLDVHSAEKLSAYLAKQIKNIE